MRESGRIRKSKTVEVEPPLEAPDPAQLITEMKQAQQNESQGMAGVLAEMIKANSEAARQQADQMQNFMLTMVTAMSQNQNSAPAVNPVEMQTSMIQSMVALKELSAPSQENKSSTDLILEGVKLVNEIRGDEGGGGEANMYSLLQKAMGEFGGALTAAQTMQGAIPPTGAPQVAPGPVAMPQPAPVPGIEQAAPTSSPAALPVDEPASQPGQAQNMSADPHPSAGGNLAAPGLAAFQPYVTWLLNMARENKDPSLYAELLVDNMGAEMSYAWIADPQGQAVLIQQFPSINEHREWFDALGRAIDELTSVDDNPPDQVLNEPETEPDNARHPSTDTDADAAQFARDTERPGGDQIDIADYGASREPSENNGIDS